MATGALIPDVLIDEAAHRFALLGDPSRLRVLRSLHESGEVSVGELAELSGLTRTNLSQHLSRLAAAGLVGRRREGTTIYYRIVDDSLAELCDLVCDSLRQRGKALAAS
jgi:DNA-binding transcriptional ArsR family regulator